MCSIVVDVISLLDYEEKINTHNMNAHIHNMSLIKLFNGYVMKTKNSKTFQNGRYVCA